MNKDLPAFERFCPSVSVIIPALNEEKNIGNSLSALLAEDYPAFEIIVVDNGSSDRTSDIASKFDGVKVLREDRKGTMWACEKGRSVASGEIIVRMDADCVPEKDWLMNGVRHFKNPRVLAVSGPYDYFDYSPLFRIVSSFVQVYPYWLASNTLQMFGKSGVVIGGNSFMRSSTLKEVGGFDTRIEFYGDDTDIAKKFSALGRVVYDRHLTLSSSARRFKAHGIFPIIMEYSKAFWGTVLKGK